MTDTLVSVLVALAAHFGGSKGWAILALSLAVRVTLLPLTLHLARRAKQNQEIFRTLQPELAEVKRRFSDKPERLWSEMQSVYKKHGYSPFDLASLLGGLAQWPIFGVLVGAIRKVSITSGRFLWMRSLASPDVYLTLLVVLLAGSAAYFIPGAGGDAKVWITALQMLVVGFVVWKLTAAMSLYWAASSLVGLGQNLWLRRELRRVAVKQSV